MVEKDNPLTELFVDTKEVDQRLLTDVLKPYIGIEKGNKKLVPRTGFASLEITPRIRVVLLAQYALTSLGISNLCSVSAAEIEKIVRHSQSKVSGVLSRLQTNGEIDKDDSGYFIPVFNVELVAKMVESAKGKSHMKPQKKESSGEAEK